MRAGVMPALLINVSRETYEVIFMSFNVEFFRVAKRKNSTFVPETKDVLRTEMRYRKKVHIGKRFERYVRYGINNTYNYCDGGRHCDRIRNKKR